jgi:adenylate kinase family enzyme
MLMKQKLLENSCRNRGYILDGFPRSFKDARYLFLTKPKKENEEEEEAEEEIEEGAEKTFKGYIIDESIAPKNMIMLEAS